MDRIIKALAEHKQEVVQCVLDTLNEKEDTLDHKFWSGERSFAAEEFKPVADYLINFLRTKDNVWRDLYLGHILLQMPQLQITDKRTALSYRRSKFDQIHQRLVDLAATIVDSDCVEDFSSQLKAAHEVILLSESTRSRVLFVGDCLMLSVAVFLTARLLADGIELQADFFSGRSLSDLRNGLQKYAGQVDLVCFSPYSFSFNPILLETWHNPNPFQNRDKLRRLCQDAHKQTRATLRMLADLFNCTVCVQNTMNIRLLDGTFSSSAKRRITARPRKIAAAEINALLSRSISEINREVTRPFITVNEASLGNRFNENALSELYHKTCVYHPTVMANELSRLYHGPILANKLLSTKKVVAIDLDDTVWKGTIGEGKVDHYVERQGTLQELKRKGVLLAIVSKNDRRNVHWTGGLLCSEDFVAEQINWDPKPTNIMRISSELNIKCKDFVFIDDRADQREIVKSSVTDILTLDATAELTWDMLRWWAASLPEQTEVDRTTLYRERKERESFLHVEVDTFDQDAIFAALKLKVEFRSVASKDLARVAELINRTSQFNTCGNRSTLEEITAQSKSSEYLILVAKARDKFGDMGIISVLIGKLTDNALVVTTWVLSCRVFGFGIERAMLNHLRRIGLRLNRVSLHGEIVNTPYNQPCREVYAENGFVQNAEVWVSGTAEFAPDPPWLEVTAN
jgi:FkbH-like protein